MTRKTKTVDQAETEVTTEQIDAEATAGTEATPEMVTVHFPAVRSKEEDNFVIVGLNGKMYKIKKGEDVQVPAGVAEIIKNSEMEQDRRAQKMLDNSI